MKILLALLFIGAAAGEVSIFNSTEVESEEIDTVILTRGAVGVRKAHCSLEDNASSCCLNVRIKKKNFNTCIRLSVDPNQLKAVAALVFNGHEIISQDAAVGKMCTPLPPPVSWFSACVNIYHAEVNLNQKRVNVCFLVEIQKVMQASFGCLRFDNGRIQHHSENPPPREGLVDFSISKGKPHISFHKPSWLG